ncbi:MULTISPECIES: glycosyltransferase [Salinibaculum]|uniref:glycosyltransferase n=1 Tax=Salinibaculum TaxID=2732368 RepID=UPI0030D1D458
MIGPDLDFPQKKQTGTGPLVSVVLATYEPDLDLVGQSLQSVANQTYDNVELVIIDSSGEEWLRTLARDHDWVEYQFQEPSGLPAAWNAGIEAASGKYVGFLADDDYYAPEKLEQQVERLKEGVDIVYTDEYVIDEDGSVTYLSSLPVENQECHYIDFFRVGHGIPHLTVVGRTTCFEDVPFDEDLEVREDPHLWVRLFRRCSVARINDALAYKRRRDDSTTSNPDMMYENERREIDLLCQEFPQLREYRTERERMAKYRYGKQLFHAGRFGEARRVLLDVVQQDPSDYRAIATLGASLLPAKNKAAFQLLERWQERLTN